MGSGSSKAKHHTSIKTGAVIPVEIEADIPVKVNTAIVPGIPREILDEILDYLVADSDLSSLRSCALVSKSWLPSCRRHLFHTVHFTFGTILSWQKAFPVPEKSPAHYIRDLRVSTGGPDGSPGGLFFRYAPWIMDVERVTFWGDGRWIPMFWRLPQSITSLTVRTDGSSLLQVRNIMAQLPNLDDLSLSGALIPLSRSVLAGIGIDLRGRFGGQLRLSEGCACKDVVDMLLEVPTGLRFTEAEIRGMGECLLLTVRLTEACCETLVKLSYAVSSYYGHEAFERSFDFSKFPNLQGVKFGVRWMSGSVVWIPKALSTIKRATSPRLSALQLSFARPPTAANRPVDALIGGAGEDLRWIAGEVARIRREFDGAVNLTMLRDPVFEAAFDALDTRRY